MFVSATKNPIRALHMLLHAPQGDKFLILIDLNIADERGNVEKAHHLKLRTKFRYTGAGEYLIFGGVEPKVGPLSIRTDWANNHKAIISHIPLSKLQSHMPTMPDDDDPFRFKILQAHEKLPHARHAMKKTSLPMTYSLGRAVGQLVGILSIPPQHFETSTHQGSCLQCALLTLECE